MCICHNIWLLKAFTFHYISFVPTVRICWTVHEVLFKSALCINIQRWCVSWLCINIQRWYMCICHNIWLLKAFTFHYISFVPTVRICWTVHEVLFKSALCINILCVETEYLSISLRRLCIKSYRYLNGKREITHLIASFWIRTALCTFHTVYPPQYTHKNNHVYLVWSRNVWRQVSTGIL